MSNTCVRRLNLARVPGFLYKLNKSNFIRGNYTSVRFMGS